MKIALGTTSPGKEKFTHEILKELGLDPYKLIAVAVPSGVADQPLSSEETRQGALNRAKGAFAAVLGADFGLGIEVGYDEFALGRFEIFAWTAAMDADGSIEHRSDAFPLPRFHNEVVVSGAYLGDHVREYVARSSLGMARVLGMHLVERDRIIKTAVYHCLLQYLNKVEFQP